MAVTSCLSSLPPTHRIAGALRPILAGLLSLTALTQYDAGAAGTSEPDKGAPNAETGARRAAAVQSQAERYREKVLAALPDDFGSKKSDETKDGKRLLAGDIFAAGRPQALLCFLPGEKEQIPGLAFFQKQGKEWKLDGTWPLSEKAQAAALQDKKREILALRPLSSDKAPEVLLLSELREQVSWYQALRYVGSEEKLREVAASIPEPFWDPRAREILAFEAAPDSNDNTVTAWRWSGGKLEPRWRAVQRLSRKRGKPELIINFERLSDQRWILFRRCQGDFPCYANPVTKLILEPIQTTGETSTLLSMPEKSFQLNAWIGVMRLISFKISLGNVLEQVCRAFYAEPEKMGPRFRLELPEGTTMYIAQFGRVRSIPQEHPRWEAPKDEKELEAHARNLVQALGSEDVFSLFELLPKDAPESLLAVDGKPAPPEAKLTPDAVARYLESLPAALQPKSGKAQPLIKEGEAEVRVETFPFIAGGKKATLVAGYAKQPNGSWLIRKIALEWEGKN